MDPVHKVLFTVWPLLGFFLMVTALVCAALALRQWRRWDHDRSALMIKQAILFAVVGAPVFISWLVSTSGRM